MKSLRLKIMWILLMFSLLPLVTATVYSYHIASKALYEKVNLGAMSTLKTVSKSVDSELKTLTAVMETSTSSREFQQTVNQIRFAQTDGEKWVALSRMDKLMIGIFGKAYSVNGIYLTLPDGESYAIKDEYRVNLNELNQQEWFQSTDNSFGTLTPCGLVHISQKKDVLLFGKLLRDVVDAGDLSVIGSIHFAIDPAILSAINVQETDESSSFIFNAQGQTIAAAVYQEVKGGELQDLVQNNWSKFREGGSGIFTVEVDGQKMMLLYDTSPLYQYRCIRLIPLSLYTSEISNITWTTAIFAVMCIIGVFFVSVVVSNHISKPINNLNSAMKYTETGHFDTYLSSRRKDEIGQIIQRFNKMVIRLKGFFEQTIADEKAKKKLEIESLQYQISPHFLNNLLASVRSLATLENAPKTVKMLSAVSKLLRTTVGSAGMLIPLRQEMENLRQLLYIQNICHNGMVLWNFVLEDELDKYLVPNLILQPVVENAVFYGANPANGLVTIQIEAKKEEKDLVITIRDHGVGIPEEKQKQIFNNPVHRGQFSHVGLFNTNERIRLNYGDTYGLELKSDENGTEVTVRLPQMLSGADNTHSYIGEEMEKIT